MSQLKSYQLSVVIEHLENGAYQAHYAGQKMLESGEWDSENAALANVLTKVANDLWLEYSKGMSTDELLQFSNRLMQEYKLQYVTTESGVSFKKEDADGGK